MTTAEIAVISGLGSGLIVAAVSVVIEIVRVRERRRGELVSAAAAFLVASDQLIAELENQPAPNRVGEALVGFVEKALPELDYLGAAANRRLFHPDLLKTRDRYLDAVARLLLIGDRRVVAALLDAAAALEKAVDDPGACASGIRQAQADIAQVVNPLGRRSWRPPWHRLPHRRLDDGAPPTTSERREATEA